MSLHLAGGIRNPESTSYINCTLQMLLHFRPFLDLLEIQDEFNNNSLVKILLNLAKKIYQTDNSISADALISFFKKDPKVFLDIIKFLKEFIEALPSEYRSIISIDDPDYPLEANGDYISNSANMDSKMIILPIDINDQQQINIDESIFIGEFKYILFSIVQISGNVSLIHNGHYSILIRDSQGWIQCNDTSVLSIPDESRIQTMIKDSKSAIELIAYISDLDLIDFNRRQVVFSNSVRTCPISNSDSSTKSSPLTKKTNSFFPSLFTKEKETELISQSSSSSSDSDISIVLDEINSKKKLKCKFFDGKFMEIVKEKDVQINSGDDYKDTAEKIKREWRTEFNDDLQYKFYVNSRFVEKIPDISTDNVTVIFERKNMQIFNRNLITNTVNPIQIHFEIIYTPVVFNAQFIEEQSFKDIKEYAETFCYEILSAKKTDISIFLIHKDKFYNVLIGTKIQKIKEILKENDLKFGISLDDLDINPKDRAILKITPFETENYFIEHDRVNYLVNIEDTCQTLLDLAKQELTDSNDYLLNLVGLKNLRIQKRIEAREIPFIPKDFPETKDLQPFSYPLKENQSLDTLTKMIKRYIKLDNKIVLKYNKETRNKSTPFNDYNKGFFSFMYVQFVK